MTIIKNSIQHWIMAIRVKTLFAALSPVLLAASFTYSQTEKINGVLFTITLLCTLLLQISSNLINDYYDGVDNVDSADRLGPLRVTAQGIIRPQYVKRGFIITLALSFLLGLILIYHGGVPIAIIGFSSLFFSWAYTAGPWPLSRFGLGEIFAFIFFGPIAVCGTYWLLAKNYHHNIFLLSFAPGLLSAALMAINNLRDRVTDAKTGKITVAVLLSEQKARYFTFSLLLSPVLLSLYYTYHFKDPFFLASSLPFFIFFKQFRKTLGLPLSREFNLILEFTGRALFINSLLLSIIILL